MNILCSYHEHMFFEIKQSFTTQNSITSMISTILYMYICKARDTDVSF